MPAAASAVEHRQPVERRRLKMIGLALAVGGVAGLGGVADQLAGQWQVGVAELLPWFALALVSGNALAAGLIVLAIGCGSARALKDPRRRRAVLWQVLVANLLVPVLLLGGVADDRALIDGPSGEWIGIAVAVGGYALCALAWRSWRHSRRQEAISADEAMALDARAPVLYLRSFRDDGVALAEQFGSPLKRRALALLRLVTPEEQMAKILSRIGPLIAIGKPGEPLPELGAARLYVAHADWQRTVAELMQRAALVVVRIGASPGVLWEIEQSLALLPRQRLVLAVLGDEPVAAPLRECLAPVVGSCLDAAHAPPAPRSWRSAVFGDEGRAIGALIGFDADGRPLAVPVRQRRSPMLFDLALLKRWGRPAPSPLDLAWQRLFVHNALTPAEARAGRSRMVAVLLALLLGWLGAHWFYLGRRRRGVLYVALLPLLLTPMFLGFADALRFLWVDRAAFVARWAMPHA